LIAGGERKPNRFPEGERSIFPSRGGGGWSKTALSFREKGGGKGNPPGKGRAKFPKGIKKVLRRGGKKKIPYSALEEGGEWLSFMGGIQNHPEDRSSRRDPPLDKSFDGGEKPFLVRKIPPQKLVKRASRLQHRKKGENKLGKENGSGSFLCGRRCNPMRREFYVGLKDMRIVRR